MDFINSAVEFINKFLWDFLLLILLCGTGIYLTFRLKFIQIRKFGEAFKMTFGSIKLKGKNADSGGMSSFQSFATAVAAQVGTGNLAGAATALIMGGPGAIFWMWVSAFFGMATIFSEATLAQQHKQTIDGEATGGPVYYIRAAFKGRFGEILAGIFAVLLILALGFMGNMVQSNSIGDAFHTAFGIPPVVMGIVVAVLSLFIFLGGVKRIASVTEKIVPVMALFYILGSLIIIFINVKSIPAAFYQIFAGAFKPMAVTGGAVGITVKSAIRYGVARGLFSNEAGMGSTPHAHAIAKVKHPCEQGYVAMMGVFLDTFIILTLTALVIILTGILGDGYNGIYEGVELTQAGFKSQFGNAGTIFIAVCMLFFAFSTIIGWYFFAETNVKYLLGKKFVKPFAVIVAGFVILGSCLKVELVWALADCFNGLMVIPNMLAVLAMSGQVIPFVRSFEKDKAPVEKPEER